jgi:hypothetical protein
MKTIMNLVTKQAATMAAALICSASLHANGMPNGTYGQSPDDPAVRSVEFQPSVFRNSTEARMLRDAYVILATGNHNYDGHRVGAMQQVRAAAELLGLEVRGDSWGGKPQELSNERLRHAKELIVQVMHSAQVKDQERVVRRLNEAVHQINVALGIK